MTTLTLIISGQTLVISGEGLTVEVVGANSSGMASEAIDPSPGCVIPHGEPVAASANAGGSHEVGPTRLKTETNISLAARESQQAAAQVSHSSRRSSPETKTAGEAVPPLATSPATNSLSAVPAAETTGEKIPQQLISPVAPRFDAGLSIVHKHVNIQAGPIDVRSPEFIKKLRPFCKDLANCRGYGKECACKVSKGEAA